MKNLIKFMQGISGVLIGMAIAGCVTKADLDLVAARNPVPCGVDKNTRTAITKSLYSADKLHGKWEGESEDQEILWRNDGWWKRFDCNKWKYLYEFKTDGTYEYKCYQNGKEYSSATGKWKYYINKYGISELDLDGLKYPYRSVFWINDDEMIITAFRTADTAVNFRLDSLVADNYPKSSWNNYVKYSRDNFLNMLWTSHHINSSGTQGYKRELHESAAVFKRIEVRPPVQPPVVEPVKPPAPAPVAPAAPSCRIVSCKLESGTDYAYKFVLELTGQDDSGKVLSSALAKLRETVKEKYSKSFPDVPKGDLCVDFAEQKRKGGKIEGRAVVLTISVMYMRYDPPTRKGALYFRINPSQREDASKWIRKNITSFASDKNIMLVAGERPTDGKFTAVHEELRDGNILEIEFTKE